VPSALESVYYSSSSYNYQVCIWVIEGLPGLASGKLYKTKYKAAQHLYKRLADKIYLILGKLNKNIGKCQVSKRASHGRERTPMLCAMVRKIKDWNARVCPSTLRAVAVLLSGPSESGWP
jgi:hypothetical protein